MNSVKIIKNEPASHETNAQSDPQTVLIAIPTFKRSSRLQALLLHIMETLSTVHDVEILVIDNNATALEKEFIQEFAKTSNYPINYIHEPQAGVSNARNAALKFAKSRFVAFLDDDMQITSAWVDSLVKVALDYKTGLVFGPLSAKFDETFNPRNVYLASFYTRNSANAEAGISQEAYGTGGCLIDLKNCILPDPPFDKKLNESGGEDDIFFETLKQNGTQYGWAPEALCYECIQPARTTDSYIARRNFGYGQGPSRIAASQGLSNIHQLLRHMSVGLAQLGVFGVLYVVLKLAKRPSQVRYLALSARGLGKVFWANRFTPKLYGNMSVDT